jgi:two-component system, NtrC family, response regulator HydG
MFDDFSDLQRELIGTTPAMVRLFRSIKRFGPTNLTILIEGESGTGKELVANALHRWSSRSRRLFVPVNCAELTETVAQSELFGHERGAFTGADRQHIGWFERASGGTLFLDEIGEIPMALQSKFLRAVQERQIHRLGGTQWIDVDVRIIAATNVDLKRAIAEHRFREDLYYRLNQKSITTPPLRERRNDIPLLAEHVMRRFCEETGFKVDGISTEVEAILQEYPWPGNVRELENVIKSTVVMASDEIVRPDHLPAELLTVSLRPGPESPATCGDLFWQVEREVHRVILIHFKGNARKAAEFLGREYRSFLRSLKRLQLS